DTRVAVHDLDASSAISHEAEVMLRQTNHIGIDFVESEVVSRLPVGRECAGAEPNNSDSQSAGVAVPLVQQGQADAAGLAVVRGGLVLPRAGKKLKAVQGAPVLQHIRARSRSVTLFEHGQDAIKIAGHGDGGSESDERQK